MDSTHLVAQCLAGDSLAVERLVDVYQPALFRLALSILDDPHEAEEVTQDALMAALKALTNFRGESSLMTWLYAIAINQCRSRLRKRQRQDRLQSVLQSLAGQRRGLSPATEETVLQHESSARVMQAVQSLNEIYRLPILLRYYHDCTIDEIAHILEIPPGTVHSRLNKARAHLKERLKTS